MGQLSSRRKKATYVADEHEHQPCVLLRYSTTTAENHPHRLDETPSGAFEIGEGRGEKLRFWRSSKFHPFRKRTGKYNLAKAEELYQSEAGSYRKITDDHTLQHTTILEICDHQEAPASEVLSSAEEQLEQDVLQPQDADAPISLPEDGSIKELDKGQDSLQHIVEMCDLQEAPASEVLSSAEEQLEQDILQPQDVDSSVSSAEDDSMEDLDMEFPTLDQTSLQHGVEIDDIGEAQASEVLNAAEEQLEQDVLQPQEVDTPVISAEDDSTEEMDNVIGHICWRYEFGHMLGKGGLGSVYAGTRSKDGLKVAVKIADKTPHMPYITVLGHPKRLPMEIGLTFMANKGPRVPQIIKLLEWQDDPDHYLMVLEHPLAYMDMSGFMKLQGGILDEGTARQVMRQVIYGANICCERGVFHRDIKLENLLINKDTLEIKMIDFGSGALITESGYVTFKGTKVNCPPEYEADGRYHAKPATVWSLGILLFIMVCGYYPSCHDLHMIRENDWSKPDLSQECSQMIRASLQPDPQQRLILEEMLLHDWFKVLKVME
ncbi:uncharacterized protein [Pseudorasbora parva]|uniref:uncharacterized protein n=1 Tax=Pseudorasbora parva TaxID=51549 RepID=UPI00351EA0A4